MKRFPTGQILFDAIDVFCISFSLGSGLAYLIRKRKEIRTVDPIISELKKNSPVIGVSIDPMISELKKESPVIAVSIDGKPLKLPLVRGGQIEPLEIEPLEGGPFEGGPFEGVSIVIKSKKLATLIIGIFNAKRKHKRLKLLLALLNAALSSSAGLRLAVGGSLDYTQIILIAFPSTLGGFLVGQVIKNPLISVLLPLAIFYGRGIEDIPDPYEKCRQLCKIAEKFHNHELAMEMKKFNSLLEDMSTGLQLPLDEVPLVCVEDKMSLLQRFKLRQLIESTRSQNRVQHFDEFIKKFPKCDANPEDVYDAVVGKIPE